jgi:hypothetical protein
LSASLSPAQVVGFEQARFVEEVAGRHHA